MPGDGGAGAGVSSADTVPTPKHPVVLTVTSVVTPASSFFIPTPDRSASLVSHTSCARANPVAVHPGRPPVRPPEQRSDGRNRDGAYQEGIQQNSHTDHETALDHGADAGKQQTAHRGSEDQTCRGDDAAGRTQG